jgi:hypothetical protein
VETMGAVVSGPQARSMWLTGAAGLLLLVTAVVMMACAAPRVHAARLGYVPGDQLASWVWVTHDSPAAVPPARIANRARP